jgi:hypothetical protein
MEVQLMGRGFNGLAGQAEIMALQTALTTLSTIPKYANANPGPVDGVMRNGVIIGLAHVISKLPAMPSKVSSAVTAVAPYLDSIDMGASALSLIGVDASIVTSKKQDALDAIGKYAGDITKGVNALIALIALSGGAQGGVDYSQAFVHTQDYVRDTTFANPSAESTPPPIATANRDGTFRVAAALTQPVGKKTHAEIQLAAPALPPNAALLNKQPYLQAAGLYKFYKDPRIMAPAGIGIAAGIGTLFLLRR